MNTSDFLRSVLPSQGHYFLAVQNPNGPGYRHKAFTNPEELANAAQYVSEKGGNAFYALANFDKAEYIGADGKKHWRTGDNAVSARCFWMDVDCGKQYEGSQRKGLTDLVRFCGEIDLPMPNFVVNSGNGLHVYWVMDQDVPKDQWRKIARVLKALAEHLNFAQDDVSRTADIASVLRPIGTSNDKRHKGLGVKPVTMLRGEAEPVSLRAFVNTLLTARDKFSVQVKQVNDAPKSNINSDLGGGLEYLPSSAHTVAEHCAQIRNFRDFRGAGQDEPTWRACLSVVKHCVEGDALAHEWSSGHAEYDKNSCQYKLDNLKGPLTCDSFRSVNEKGCAACKHKCKSPIQLGVVAPVHVEEIVHQTTGDDEHSGVKVEALPPLPEVIRRNFRFDPEAGLLARKVSPEGVVDWVSISQQMIIGEGYYSDRDDNGAWKMKISVRAKPYTWVQASISVKCVGQGGAMLLGELASNAMVTTGHPKLLENYMKTWAETLRAEQEEIAMHSYMGWQEDQSFVVGENRYMPDGTVREVVLTDTLRKSVLEKLKFTPAGDPDRYRELIDFAYNRKDHEAYQFTYLAGYGSILLPLLEQAPLGIVFSAYSTKPGKGKSTVAKLAGGIWHDPTEVVDAKGTTEFAMYASAGLRRNLPLVIDEITQWEPQRSGEFAYRYSSGRSKEQGAASGGLRDNSHLNWSNFVICTGNKSQVDIIKTYNRECQAQLARVFEYEFTTEHEATMSIEEGRPVIEELMRMRGIGGQLFSEYVVANRESVAERLLTTYNKLMNAANLSKDARFWGMGCACVWVAYEITRSLGLHSFAPQSLLKWIIDQLKAHDASSKSAEVNYLALFGDALAELQTGFIVTTNRGTKSEHARLALGWNMPRTGVTGRVIMDENLLAVSASAVVNWCRENKVDKSQMVKELKRAGWLYKSGNGRLGSYTSMPGSVVRMYELDMAKFSGGIRLAVVNGEPTQRNSMVEEAA